MPPAVRGRALKFAGNHPWWSALIVLLTGSLFSGIPGIGMGLAVLLFLGGAAGIVYGRTQRAALPPAANRALEARGVGRQNVVIRTQPQQGQMPSYGSSRSASRRKQTTEERDLAAIAQQLRLVPFGALDEQVEVAGETYHVKGIKQVFGEAEMPIMSRGTTLEDLECVLVPEPWNPHDPDAVAVLIGDHQVGYLPAETAMNYATPLRRRASNGELMTGVARVWAKSDGGVVRARVTLLIGEPDLL